MKLLISGKSRNIYFRKDNTAYYKSNGNENDITHYFKKKGGLKKQYSNLLVENNKVLKNRKIIIGGAEPIKTIFENITITIPSIEGVTWEPLDKAKLYRSLLQLALLTKIECENNTGHIKFLNDDTEQRLNKLKFIRLLEIICGNYFNEHKNLSTHNIPYNQKSNEVGCLLQSGNLHKFYTIINHLNNSTTDEITAEIKAEIKIIFTNIPYKLLGEKLDYITKQIKQGEGQGQVNLQDTTKPLDNLKELIIEMEIINTDGKLWETL